MSQRRAPRIRAAIGAILRQGEQREPCLTQSVSATGIAVSTRKTWDPETMLQVELVEEGYRLSTEARVVKHEGTRLALAFDENDPNVEPVMSGLMDALLNRAGGGGEGQDFSDLGNLDGKIRWSEVDQSTWNPFAKKFNDAVLADIAHEGASIESRKVPDVGTKIVVVLEHDELEDRVLKVHAEIVRHTENGFAVSFVKPSREVRSYISKLRSFQRLGD